MSGLPIRYTVSQGRSGLSKADMLERLQEAVADIEQLKADLLSTGRRAKHPAASQKKRKAQSVTQHHAMSRGQSQSRKQKANAVPAFGLSSIQGAFLYTSVQESVHVVVIGCSFAESGNTTCNVLQSCRHGLLHRTAASRDIGLSTSVVYRPAPYRLLCLADDPAWELQHAQPRSSVTT